MSEIEAKLSHIPVLRKTVQEFLFSLPPKRDGMIVDGTIGMGGHTTDILSRLGETGKVYGFELDEDHCEEAKKNLSRLGKADQVILIHENFDRMEEELKARGVEKIDGILLDLGLASPHVERPERGFSFQKEGPLDMRFDIRQPLTAAEIINHRSLKDLAEIFRIYGEEKYAWKIAQKITEERRKKPIRTTIELAALIEKVMPNREKRFRKTHCATKVFQALRIAVNRELESLSSVLPQTLAMLKQGGRIVVISYHSLEDRIVKDFFRQESRDCLCPPEIIICQCQHKAQLKILTKKPMTPDEEELHANPRSRSAKLRAAEKLTS